MTTNITYRFTLTILTVFLLGRMASMVFMPLSEPSEARYAVMVKNMADSGNFLEPNFIFRGKPECFEGKPALPFQLGGIACLLFGTTVFATRIPSFIALIIILGAIYRAVSELRNPTCAYTAVLLCCCSYIFYIFGGVMMTDMVLVCGITLSIISYIYFCSTEDISQKKWYSIAFFASMGFGMIAKGPVAIVMAGLPIFFFVLINNRWRELKYHAWIWGTLAFALICVPWYGLMTWKNPDFLYYFFVEENFNRFLHAGAAARFGAARQSCYGMAIIWFILANIPLVFALPMFSIKRIKSFYQRSIFSDPLGGIAALTVIVIPGFWCLTSQSLLPYLIPTTPFLAILLAVRFNDTGELEQPGRVRAIKIFTASCAILFMIITLIAIPVGESIQPNLNTKIYTSLQEIKQQKTWSDTPVYFMNLAPYSAEFYLNGLVINHVPETPDESVERSSNYILVASEREIAELSDSARKRLMSRRLIIKCQTWNAFAPEESQPVLKENKQ